MCISSRLCAWHLQLKYLTVIALTAHVHHFFIVKSILDKYLFVLRNFQEINRFAYSDMRIKLYIFSRFKGMWYTE